MGVARIRTGKRPQRNDVEGPKLREGCPKFYSGSLREVARD